MRPLGVVDVRGLFGGRAARLPVACTAAGLAATALAGSVLTASPGLAAGLGIRVGLGVWCAVTLVSVFRGTPPAARHSWLTAVAVAVLLLAATLQRAPGRLAANALSFLALVTPLVWLAHRRAGRAGAAWAATAVGVFVLLPTHVDWRQIAGPDNNRQDTPFIWSVGWPAPEAALRHEIRVPPSLAGQKTSLTIVLADRYTGDARIQVSANGTQLGPAQFAGERGAYVAVPESLAHLGETIAFELRLAPFDRRLRLLAHRWVAGATRGADASAYFTAGQWWPGTFDDAGGGARAGTLLLMLDRTA